MKKIYILLLAAAMLLFCMTGCGENGNEPIDDTDEDMSRDLEELELFSGLWWYREEPVEGMSMDIFALDGAGVIFYDENGNEMMRGDVRNDGEGIYTMILELFGEIEFQIDETEEGWVLTTLGDGASFTLGAPIDSMELAGDFTGRWYEKGDPDADYIEFNEDGSYGLYSDIFGEIIAREEGSWALENRDGNKKQIVVDASFSNSYYFLTDDGKAMWNSDDAYFLKEALIDTEEGEIACRSISLFAARHWEPENKGADAIYLVFREDGTLTVQVAGQDGYIEDRGSGSWALFEGNSYDMTLDDGTTHHFRVDNEVMTLDDGSQLTRFSYFG